MPVVRLSRDQHASRRAGRNLRGARRRRRRRARSRRLPRTCSRTAACGCSTSPRPGLLLVDHGGRDRATGASGDRAQRAGAARGRPRPGLPRGGRAGRSCPTWTRTSLRWPEFTAAATAAGFASAHTVPMRRRAEVIGALTLFRTAPGDAGQGHRPDRPGAGRPRDDRAAAGQARCAGRRPGRAAAARADQPGGHRAGEGRGRRAARHSTWTRRSTRCAATRAATTCASPTSPASVVDGSFDTALLIARKPTNRTTRTPFSVRPIYNE